MVASVGCWSWRPTSPLCCRQSALDGEGSQRLPVAARTLLRVQTSPKQAHLQATSIPGCSSWLRAAFLKQRSTCVRRPVHSGCVCLAVTQLLPKQNVQSLLQQAYLQALTCAWRAAREVQFGRHCVPGTVKAAPNLHCWCEASSGWLRCHWWCVG